MRAFHGDEALKGEVVARLEREIASGALSVRSERDDPRTGVVAILAGSGDPAATQERLGIPADVLGLLDHVTGHIYFGLTQPIDTARRFLAACAVGADLSLVVPMLLRRLVASRPFNDDPVYEVKWDGPEDPNAPVALSNDTVMATIDEWLDTFGRVEVRRSGWSDSQEAAAQAALQEHWVASRERRRTGDWPDYPALFRKSHPELAAGYEAALDVMNASYERNARRVIDWFIDAVAAAGVAA